ncbi:MAG: ATPase P [Lachnospiraceae bacterium]|nr:ATPase P [Lachnospiraceae bacterium]
MIIKPRPLGASYLDPAALAEDKKNCIKIGPCGVGEKAIYLNSFYLDRVFYVQYTEIRRIFKRVAMSKGGFTGKGLFGSIPYLVVQFKDGTEKQCNFKIEDRVDQVLAIIHERFPDMPVHSKEAERKLAEAEAAERAKYLKELTPEAESSVHTLEDAKKVLTARPEVSRVLAFTAKQKRTLDSIHPTYRLLAVAILIAAILCASWGFRVWMQEGLKTGGLYVLGGFAFIFFVISSQVLPTGRNNKRYGEECYKEALKDMKALLGGGLGYPVPVPYAHPIVIDRMIRAIRQGRAVTVEESMDVVKADLKALNPSVTVSQKEYDEVVVVKPLFTVNDYA